MAEAPTHTRQQRPPKRKRRWLGWVGPLLVGLALFEVVEHLFPAPFVYGAMRNVVQQECTRPHPVMQYVNRENYAGTFANREFRTAVRINSHGLRDREYPYEKGAGTTRCLVLGDSFAFGWGVEAEESVAKMMEARERGVEFLNGGCSGWGTRQEFQFLREEGIRYHPDVVLLFYCDNDPEDNAARYQFVRGRLMLAGEREGLRGDVNRFLLRHSALWILVARLRHVFSQARQTPRQRQDAEGQAWAVEANLLAGMQRFCQERGARLAVVYVPAKDGAGRPVLGSTLGTLKSTCARAGIPLLDLVAPLSEASRREPVYFHLDDHWTRAGHAAAAEATLGFLRGLGWLPRS